MAFLSSGFDYDSMMHSSMKANNEDISLLGASRKLHEETSLITWSFCIEGTTQSRYQVKMGGDGATCTCPKFAQRQEPCKHILFLSLRVLRLAASCETLTDVLDRGFSHVLFPTQEETKSSMCSTCFLKGASVDIFTCSSCSRVFHVSCDIHESDAGMCRKCTLVPENSAHHPLTKFDPLFSSFLPPPGLVIIDETCVGRRKGSTMKRVKESKCVHNVDAGTTARAGELLTTADRLAISKASSSKAKYDDKYVAPTMDASKVQVQEELRAFERFPRRNGKGSIPKRYRNGYRFNVDERKGF